MTPFNILLALISRNRERMMAIAWISGIINTSGSTFTTWVQGVPNVGGHTGKSPQYNDGKEWGVNNKISIPSGSNWTVSDCAIPYFGQGNTPPRRYLEGPSGTVYFDTTLNPDIKGEDAMFCYNSATGEAIGSPIPIGKSGDSASNTLFSIVMTAPSGSGSTLSGVSFVYQSSNDGLPDAQQAFDNAVSVIVPLVSAVLGG